MPTFVLLVGLVGSGNASSIAEVRSQSDRHGYIEKEEQDDRSADDEADTSGESTALTPRQQHDDPDQDQQTGD